MLEQFKSVARGWLAPESEENVRREDNSLSRQLSSISLEYAYSDLAAATNSFSKDCQLGAGAAGAVYKGSLRGGSEVAVKVLLDNGGLCGFEDEVRVLSRFRHPNLVTLMGWGAHGNEKYLVYELLSGGDVTGRLEKSEQGKLPFTWQQRLRVALDSACGLSHMMNSEPKAFHRDIKPANILLDLSGAAKMADFGLAATIAPGQGAGGRQHLTVANIAGTPGYACPAYIQSGRVTEQSEVYAFGTVLLELLLNMRPALSGPMGDIIYPILQTVQPGVPGEKARVLSHLDMRAGWPHPLVDHLTDLTLSCVAPEPRSRPLFEGIVKILRTMCMETGAGGGGALPAQPQPQPMMPGPAGGGMPGQMGQMVHPAPQPSPPRQSPADPSAQLGEIVLECVHADGLDLYTIQEALKALAFQVDPARGRLVAQVGRQHQPDFFERLVPNKAKLAGISRSHFEMTWEPPASNATLRKLSGNTLLLDDRPVNANEAIIVSDGMRLAFSGMSESDPRFLVLRVTLKSRGAVSAEGAHPSIAARRRMSAPSYTPVLEGQQPSPQGSVAGVLHCVHAKGTDLSSMSRELTVIPLAVDEFIDIGRQHQLGFFERLLKSEPQWLGYISRSHCRLRLSTDAPSPGSPADVLRIENMSQNVVLVGGRVVSKGQDGTIGEGGTLAFVAAKAGSEETKFLEFVLRRTRSRRTSMS